jgi:signal transduction histidine kinase
LETIRSATRRLPRTLLGLSIVFVLGICVEGIVGFRYHALGIGFAISVATSLPFVAGIGYGGRWLTGSNLHRDRDRRIAGWCLGSAGVFLGMNLLLMFVVPPANAFEIAIWIRWAGTIGTGTGLLIGVLDARAIERGLSAERARKRADEADSHRELLDYLNALLRHEVLNSANVIDGRSALLLQRDALEAQDRDDLETIRRRARDLTRIIEDARVLLQATTGDTNEEVLDVVTVLERELETLTDYDRSVTVETDFPASAPVLADALLPRVFSNLLANAIEHHDGDEPTVHVTVETTSETVRVAIEDDGPGVPAGKRDILFDREDADRNHGIGLSLVSTLLERYVGTIELTDTGPSGSVFTVELPHASGREDVSPPESVAEHTEQSARGTPSGVTPD